MQVSSDRFTRLIDIGKFGKIQHSGAFNFLAISWGNFARRCFSQEVGVYSGFGWWVCPLLWVLLVRMSVHMGIDAGVSKHQGGAMSAVFRDRWASVQTKERTCEVACD